LLEKIKTIYLNILGLSPDKIAPTVGLNIAKIDIGEHRFNFWDLVCFLEEIHFLGWAA
jgi:ADP-ribosylation factor related protein 1